MMRKDQHIHTHNGRESCTEYASCTSCHCHLQDERHTACCTGSTAKEMYATRKRHEQAGRDWLRAERCACEVVRDQQEH